MTAYELFDGTMKLLREDCECAERFPACERCRRFAKVTADMIINWVIPWAKQGGPK